ncbi:hypothetical protein OsI_32155 [Oryza sativa Indica Group]|uniref:Uncharacterized protein n=1 Tax=Oryza sativa subsp. indica TaxID=39946 RepID=B8BDU8_ORYSI|nr:hypothetical protein OsI_32155 [Oryza sativa Indica Group]
MGQRHRTTAAGLTARRLAVSPSSHRRRSGDSPFASALTIPASTACHSAADAGGLAAVPLLQTTRPNARRRRRGRHGGDVAIGGRSCAGQHFGFTVASIPMLFPPSGAAAAWKVARWWPRGNPLMRGRRHGDIRCWSVLFLTKAEQAGPTRLIGSCRINLTI